MHKLDDLEPETKALCVSFLAACAREGLLLRVTQGLRTYPEQDAIFAQGRTQPGVIVSSAPAGYSWHNFGRAFDVCQEGHEPYPEDEAFWEKIGGIGESLGLEWGGRWKHPDRPHFQHIAGVTLAQARAAHDERNLA